MYNNFMNLYVKYIISSHTIKKRKKQKYLNFKLQYSGYPIKRKKRKFIIFILFKYFRNQKGQRKTGKNIFAK